MSDLCSKVGKVKVQVYQTTYKLGGHSKTTTDHIGVAQLFIVLWYTCTQCIHSVLEESGPELQMNTIYEYNSLVRHIGILVLNL